MIIGFPGCIYDGEGVCLEGRVPDLTQADLDQHPHKATITATGLAPVTQLWLPHESATFEAIHPEIRERAAWAVLHGIGIMLACKIAAPIDSVRSGLLGLLEATSATALLDRSEGLDGLRRASRQCATRVRTHNQ